MMNFEASPLARDIERALARRRQWEHPLRRFRALNYSRLNKGDYTWEDYQRGLGELEQQLTANEDPRRYVDPLLVELCAEYRRGDDHIRTQIREFVRPRKDLGGLLWRYANRFSGQLQGPADAPLAERALAAVVIESCGANYRDTLMTLADLFVAAESAGIDPRPLFVAAATMATDALTPGGCESLARMLREFHACSVLSERRALGHPYGGPT